MKNIGDFMLVLLCVILIDGGWYQFTGLKKFVAALTPQSSACPAQTGGTN